MKKVAALALSLISFGTAFGQTTAVLSGESRVTAGGDVNNTTTSVFVAEGSTDGTSAQYSIGQWSASSFGFTGSVNVTGATLNLFQSSSSFGLTGDFGIYLLTNPTLPIGSYTYNTANQQGFGSDIAGSLSLLNTEVYTAGSATGTEFSYGLTLNSTELASINQQINSSNGNLYLVIAVGNLASDINTATAFAGIGKASSGYAPSLTLTTQAVPEPASLLLVAPAAGLLLLRKRSV